MTDLAAAGTQANWWEFWVFSECILSKFADVRWENCSKFDSKFWSWVGKCRKSNWCHLCRPPTGMKVLGSGGSSYEQQLSTLLTVTWTHVNTCPLREPPPQPSTLCGVSVGKWSQQPIPVPCLSSAMLPVMIDLILTSSHFPSQPYNPYNPCNPLLGVLPSP